MLELESHYIYMDHLPLVKDVSLVRSEVSQAEHQSSEYIILSCA